MQFLFAVTLLLSATLLFAVQPMFAKMVLPLLGGTPAVWNTCMVFYQAALLAGYVYAHLSIKWLGVPRQAVLHLILMFVPWVVLPIGVAQGWTPPAEAYPVPWLLMLLTVSVGLPFLLVSASAPMLQAWFAATGHRSARDPYFLYAASNLGSMLALIGYPLLVEPSLTLRQQSQAWATGYLLLMLWVAACAVLLWKSRRVLLRPATGSPAGAKAQAAGASRSSPAAGGSQAECGPCEPLTWSARLHWLALALVPSSLLLGVTTFLSTDIASMPLLWVIPLALYLLTFVLAFARWQILPHRWLALPQAILVVIVAGAFFLGDWHTSPIAIVFPVHLLLFFLTAMVCHGELADRRPAPAHLTEFYLWISVGGVLGGLLSALVAPLVFRLILEYPIALAAACMLRPWPGRRHAEDELSDEEPDRATSAREPLCSVLDLVLPLTVAAVFGYVAVCYPPLGWKYPTSWNLSGEWKWWDNTVGLCVLMGVAGLSVLLMYRRPVRFGLGVAALVAVSFLASSEEFRPLDRKRSFFGVLEVKHIELDNAHQLVHGSTSHGMQSLDEKQRLEPWTYYHRTGPVGVIFEALGQRNPPIREIGVVGLGTGTLAAYAEKGQRITFFEIDTEIQRIAENPEYFTYLTDCRARGAQVDIILGDARLSLAKVQDRKFDVLLVDAFSSDAIPVHLITREALELYFQRLAPQGLLVVHISNRYLDLEPVLAGLAEDLGIVARVCEDDAEREEGKSASTWVVIARDRDHLDDLVIVDEAEPGEFPLSLQWKPLNSRPEMRLWTDDYSNIVGVLLWDSGWRNFPPSRWCASLRDWCTSLWDQWTSWDDSGQ